ncbi:MAG: uroporphyrinogen decarboxylase family protein [Phycisphaerales bacterium]
MTPGKNGERICEQPPVNQQAEPALTGRARVHRTIRCEAVDRVPWVPFVGCHGGSLLGVEASEYLRSEDLIVEGTLAAIERYRPDGIPVTFDLQLEAEALGCELAWSPENPPAVVRHPLAEGVPLSDLTTGALKEGRPQMVLAAAGRIRQRCPDIALYGLVTGPFTLALHLQGTDIFMRMFDCPSEIRRLLTFCRAVCEAMAAEYIEAGCDVVAVVDPMTSQIGPDHFREFVQPHIVPVFEMIRRKGALSSFFVCGHAEQNLQAMSECGCDNISIDENIGLDTVRAVCLEKHISFGGNLQLTTVLLLGTPQEAQQNALACLDIGGERGFILSPGCDLPYATPPENLAAIAPLVADPYLRDVVRAMTPTQTVADRLDLHEYGQHRKVIVDIITLDSEACAPCQYMVDAVRRVAPHFEGIVEWREHKIKYRESLVFMTSLMVHNVPTICIDGQITFVSRIPPKDELIAAIQERINEKFRLKLQRQRGALYLLGPETELMQKARRNVDQALMEMGSDIPVHYVEDEREVATFGVLPEQTPAVVLAQYQLKATRSQLEVNVIKEWIKDLS